MLNMIYLDDPCSLATAKHQCPENESMQVQKQMDERNAICRAAQCRYRPCQTKTDVHVEKYSQYHEPRTSPPWETTEFQEEKAEQDEDEGTAKLPKQEQDGYIPLDLFTCRYRHDEHRDQPDEERPQVGDVALCQGEADLRQQGRIPDRDVRFQKVEGVVF